MIIRKLVSALTAAAIALAPMAAQAALPSRPAAASAIPMPDIAYTRYTLSNGLTLIVHEDHKAPIVSVNVWYHVGSKNEPRGRSGFAHLFEHLMFNGSENHRGDWFPLVEGLGATDLNGTTNTDRTNYFQNVPVGALDTILWMESDRMGHLLGAIDQAVLDEQRGVVQNEKRQGENEPYGLVEEMVQHATYPEEHPYGHTVIGSMDDLNAADLASVQDWFRTYYGAANAVIVVAGDITPEEAKAKVEKYFGDIPPGPPIQQPKVSVAKMVGNSRGLAYDRVAQARLYRVYNIPETGARDTDLLDMLSDVLVSNKTSRLYNRLVYTDQTATAVSAFINDGEVGSQFWVQITARPGDDLKAVEKALDEEMARLLTQGPTAAELERVRNARLSGFINGLQRIGGFGGKSDILASSLVFRGSPDAWKETFRRWQTATPAEVRDAGRRWLSDGSYTLEVLPFPNYAAASAGVDRRAGPPQPAAAVAPRFPAVERGVLSNGMKVVVANRPGLPIVSMSMAFNAGYSADQFQKPGTASLAMNMLDEGTRTRNSLQISEDLARLGAQIGTGSGLDASFVTLSALKANLDASLDLYADVILNPSFPASDFDRLKRLQIAQIQREKLQPTGAAFRVIPGLVYGQGHAYAAPFSGSGTEASVASLTLADLQQFHATWFQPNNATLIIVGDTTLAEITPRLEAKFGSWRATAAVPNKNLAAVNPPAKPVIYLIDRPGALQTVITASQISPARGDADDIAIAEMNTVLGGAFTSRLNMNLREDKHWSYGAGSLTVDARGPGLFIAYAPVQTDKTRESFAEMQRELREVGRTRGITAEETLFAQNSMILGLPGSWETNQAVQGSLIEQLLYNLPDDYFDTYSGRVRALSARDLDRVAQRIISPESLTWVVVGDRAKIEAGIRSFGYEVRIVDADGNPVR
ncbi:MAG: insulinase family protein [Caulobacteraceae bacterium]|nr:insulinase family protein [Caulobacteraceae bacterium]